MAAQTYTDAPLAEVEPKKDAPTAAFTDQPLATFKASNEKDAEGNATVDEEPNTVTNLFKHLLTQVDPVTPLRKMITPEAAASATGAKHPEEFGPLNAIKNIGKAHEAVFREAQKSYEKGDYTTAARHFVDYLIPIVGPGVDKAADFLQAGKWAAGAGDSLGIGLAVFAPKALHDTLTQAKMPAGYTAASSGRPGGPGGGGGLFTNPNPEAAAAVEFARQQGIPVTAGTATGNPMVQTAEHALGKSTLGGSIVTKGLRAAHDAKLAEVGADVTGAATSPETPVSAGEAVRDALMTKAQGHSGEASAAYDDFRTIEEHPDNVRRVRQGTERNPDTGRMQPKFEDVPLPVDLSPTKVALKPVVERIARLMPQAQREASPAFNALQQLMESPRYVRASDVEQMLGALKGEARGGGSFADLSQGIAKKAIAALESDVQNAFEDVEGASESLAKGRAATVAKYDTLDSLKKIGATFDRNTGDYNVEPVKVVDQLTAPRDVNINKLNQIAEHTPEVIEKVGQAKVQQLLEGMTKEGDVRRAAGAKRAWDAMGDQTKEVLFPKPSQRAALDKFFRYADLAERNNPNPSQTAFNTAAMGNIVGTALSPVTGIIANIGAAGAAKLFSNSAFVDLLTKKMTMPPAAAGAAAVTAKLASMVDEFKGGMKAGEGSPLAKTGTGGNSPTMLGRLGQMVTDESGMAAIRTGKVNPIDEAAAKGVAHMILGKSGEALDAALTREGVKPGDLEAVKGKADKLFQRQVEKTGGNLSDTKYLLQKFEEGKAGMEWYDKTFDELKTAFGDDAELVAKLLSATSVNATVSSNVTLALKAYRYMKEGRNFLTLKPGEGFLPAVVGNLDRIAKGEPIAGRKLDNFAKAIIGDPDAVVVDRWMLRAFGYGGTAAKEGQIGRGTFGDVSAASAREYDLIEHAVKELAQEKGVTPRQMQAAIWFGQKEMEEAGKNRPPSPPFEDLIKNRRENTLSEVAKQVKMPDAGFTVQPVTGVEPKTGFGLSVMKDREQTVPVDKMTKKALIDFVQKNWDVLKDKDNYVGGWHNPEDGQLYLDVSKVVKTAKEAEMISRQHNQKAYFDFAKGKSVPLQ